LALASSRSIRPFCYDECTTSHNINSMPYSAMTHPDRETISEIFLDQLHVNFDEEDPNYSDYDVSDEFDDDYIPQSGFTASITEKIDEDFGLLDEMLEDNDFLSSLYYEQVCILYIFLVSDSDVKFSIIFSKLEIFVDNMPSTTFCKKAHTLGAY
jgi:hypothetical protein